MIKPILVFLLCCGLIGCTDNDLSKDQYLAVFATVGASPTEFESSTNHIKISKSMSGMSIHDMGFQIKPCEVKGAVFCLNGYIPIIIPEFAGDHKYRVDDEDIYVKLIAPKGLMRHRGDGRHVCDISIGRIEIERQNETYGFVFSKRDGIIEIELPVGKKIENWRLISGKIGDVGAACG